MGSERPCHILLTAPDLKRIGGVAGYAGLLMKHADPARARITHLPIGRKVGGLFSTVWFRPLDFVLNHSLLAWTIIRDRPDLVHVNPSLKWRSLPESLGMLLVARWLRRPVLLYIHGWDERIAQAMIRRRWHGRMLLRMLRQAQHYVVLAAGFRRQLIAAGLPAGKISLLPMMTEVEPVSPALGFADSRDGMAFRVLWLSRMYAGKGIWVTMAAAEIVARTHPEARLEFCLVGSGPALRPARAHVRRRGLQSVVRLPGVVLGEAKARLYRSADLFVWPSVDREGFPHVIAEALGAGLPIVYTKTPSLSEVLSSQNGIGIEPEDLSAATLAECIWNLYQAPLRRQAMAEANRRLAAERFSVNVVCRQMEDLYRQVLRRQPPVSSPDETT